MSEPHPVEEAVALTPERIAELRKIAEAGSEFVPANHPASRIAFVLALLSALERQKEALEAARHHIAARDALEDANILAMDVNDPRFAAVTDTLEHLRAALNKEPSHG